MLMLSIVSVARDALRGLMLSLCDIIYRLIVFVYDVFYNLGTARLLTDKDIQPIFQRIGLIIGLFMVFRVTFAFIQYIINPEAMIDKQKGIGKIVAKVIISIVLLGSTQYLFNAAFTIQNKVLESQVLEKVILGGEYAETESGMRDFGSNLSATIFSSFYRINDDPYLSKPEVYNLCENILGKNNDMLKENIRINSGSIVGSGANICLNVKSEYNNYDEQMEEIISSSKETKEEYIINFDGDGILTVLVGLVCLYTGFMFTFQIGVRLIQLAYLELIAPIPIMMYVTPKGDEQLKKWVTQCTTTFLDFFLRVAIIYFAKFIIEIILNADILGSIYAESNGIYNVYITCVMIIATLLFVKKVPNLLKEIFPSLGGAAGFDYGLSFKKTFVEPLKSAYNSPLGWGLKLGKAGAVAGIGAIDRKIHNLPKPRNKFQQKLDKLMPGRAEYIKNKNQGIVDAKERNKLYTEGAGIYKKYNGDLKDDQGKLKQGVFKHNEFKKTWQKVADAKKEQQKYADDFAQVQQMVTTGRISTDSEIYKTASKQLRAAESRLESAKKDHDNSRKVYTDDARQEDAFNYYKDMQESDPEKARVVDKELEEYNKEQEAKRKAKEEAEAKAKAKEEAEAKAKEEAEAKEKEEERRKVAAVLAAEEAEREKKRKEAEAAAEAEAEAAIDELAALSEEKAEADRLFSEVGIDKMSDEQQKMAFDVYEMIRKAEERRDKAIGRMAETLSNPDTSDDEKIRAAEILEKLKKDNK